MSSKGGEMTAKPKGKIQLCLSFKFCPLKLTTTTTTHAFRISHVSQILTGRKISIITTNQKFRHEPYIVVQANDFTPWDVNSFEAKYSWCRPLLQ